MHPHRNRGFKAESRLVLLALTLGGCSLAPKYTPPQLPVPAEWPQGAAYKASTPGAATVSQIGWREFYRDERLRTVVEQSLTNNRDLRIATLNIERARALYRIRRADQFPTVGAVASESAERTPGSISPTGEGSTFRSYRVEVGFASYELDLFGRVRNLKEQSLQEYLAIAETRRSAQISLVSEVAATWLTLATDQALLKLSENTLESRSRSFELTRRSYELGVASALDLERARSSVETARDDVAASRRLVAQDRNALQLLVGAPVPETLLPDASVDPVTALTDLPAGMVSSVLLQRPDILAAERRLIGAHANIGAARAAFFPSISLTASAGTASDSLSGLLGGGSGVWSFAPQIAQPIFTAGRNRARLRVAETDRDIFLADYEKAIQIAFREVADALAGRGTIDDQLAAKQALVAATQRTYDLTEARYRAGIDSSLSLLDAQRELYAAQQTLIDTQLARETNLVTLYKVLGGGWRTGP
jgi:multidrug efflux system outer membrane protein